MFLRKFSGFLIFFNLNITAIFKFNSVNLISARLRYRNFNLDSLLNIYLDNNIKCWTDRELQLKSVCILN